MKNTVLQNILLFFYLFNHFLNFKTMKKYLFLLVGFSFLMAGCGKIEVAAPQHVNKFTCKVNGVFWEAVSKQRDILGNDLQINKSPFSDFASISAWNTSKRQSISFNLSLSDTLKTFSMTVSDPFGDYARKCEGYSLDKLTNHKVIVTEHDKTKQIVKGAFSFRAIDISTSCRDTVTITDGFFDMQY
jgi:hypothetical protein